MSILYFILALFACAVSAGAGAFAMRFVTERNREIAEQEDPRDTQIRGLQAQVRLAANEQKHNSSRATSSTEHVALAHDRIEQLLDEVRNLRNGAQSQEALLSNDHEEKEILRNKLSVASAQLDTLKQRNQELEVELSVAVEPDMLSTNGANSATDETEADPFDPAESDDSPSLIQALTGELDRWKRHCHVLGDELKNQRQRFSEVNETMTEGTAISEIDELTDIRGIGAVLARKLHSLGIYQYEKLLNLSDDDMERARLLIPDFDRRMQRDSWLEQARLLHSNKQQSAVEPTAHSSASA